MNRIFLILTIIVLTFCSVNVYAQLPPHTSTYDSSKIYIVVKNDGTIFTGRILSSDIHEIILRTITLGDVAIPKHEIREIKEANPGDLNKKGQFIPEELFPERYFYSTSAFSLPKGESYLSMHILGIEYTYGITNQLSIGVATSWFPVPLIIGLKYSFNLTANAHAAVGVDAMSGTWALPGVYGILPYGAVTLGDKRNNLTIAGGYGTIGGTVADVSFSGGQGFLMISGITKLSRKADFVFESYLIPVSAAQNAGTLYIIVPGIRLQTSEKKSWQFGIGGAGAQGQFSPLPMIGYLVRL